MSALPRGRAVLVSIAAAFTFQEGRGGFVRTTLGISGGDEGLTGMQTPSLFPAASAVYAGRKDDIKTKTAVWVCVRERCCACVRPAGCEAQTLFADVSEKRLPSEHSLARNLRYTSTLPYRSHLMYKQK